jgi:C_GCAxxG_C_C family probable redox protein
MNKAMVEEAIECFSGNCNCCQSIILTYGPKFGLEKEVGIRLGTGFAGGLARQGEVCGAVTGAIMVIGLANGMKDENDSEGRDKTYELVNQFIEIFNEKNKSIICRELLDCDLRTSEGRTKAEEQGLFKTHCPNFVRNAAEILEELIL